jgi:hypothetical protein
MRLSLLALTLAAGLLACERGPQVTEVPPESCASSDMRAGDLPPPTPACAAAQGLPGDNLLCVDFDKLPSLSDSKLMGWDFEQAARGCWELLGGKLQVRSFSTFMGSCGFLLPPLSSADYQKYASFTLSIVHTIDLNKAKQKVQLMLRLPLDPSDAAALVFQTTGILAPPAPLVRGDQVGPAQRWQRQLPAAVQADLRCGSRWHCGGLAD